MRWPLALFATGNADARLLAMQIADPGKLDEKTADAWLKAARWAMDTYYLGAAGAQPDLAGAA